MGKRQVVLEPKLCKITGLSHVLAPTGVDTFVRGGGRGTYMEFAIEDGQ